MLVGSALQSSDSAPNIGGAIESGVGLAMKIQQVKQGQEQLAQQKEMNEFMKLDKVTGAIETGLTKVPKKAQAAYFKGIRDNVAGKLGYTISDSFFDALTSPDVNQGAIGQQFVNFREAVRTGVETKDFTAAKEIAPQLLEAFGGDVTKFSDFMNTAMGSEASAFAQVSAAKAADKRQDKTQTFTAGQADKTNAEAFASKLVTANIPSIKVTLGKIDKTFVPGGLDKYDGKSQIPGIGGAESAIPSGRLSKVQSDNRQLMEDLKNDYIKMMTGQGMGVEEAVRLGNSLGFGLAIGEGGGVKAILTGYKDSASAVKGIKNLKDKMREIENTYKAGAGPAAVKYYEDNKRQFDRESSTPASGAPKVTDDQIIKGLKAMGAAAESNISKIAAQTGRTEEQVRALLKKVK